MGTRLRTAVVGAGFAAMLLAAPSAHATFPGANGEIAYQLGGQRLPPFYADCGSIHVMDQTGANDVTLTTGCKPVWSPDGAKIAFDDRYLDAMNADGSGSHTILTPGFNPKGGYDWLQDATWSPQGDKLAFIFVQCEIGSSDCFTDLQTVNADGTGRNDIVAETEGPTAPAWSPDGTKIAFLGNGCQLLGFCPSDIYTVNPDGTGLTRLTHDASPDTGVGYGPPDWSPDSSRLLFDRSYTAYTMNRDGSGLTPISGPRGTNLVWSPDGKKIAFATFGGGFGDVATANADGSGQTHLTNNSTSDYPDWQPIPGPQRSDYNNAAQFCKAEREFLGDAAFARKYGSNSPKKNAANAHGKCVSGK